MLMQRLHCLFFGIILLFPTYIFAQSNDEDAFVWFSEALHKLDWQEIGISPINKRLLRIRLVSVLEKNLKKMDEQNHPEMTQENYIEVAEAKFSISSSVFEKIRDVVREGLTEEQYAKLIIRIYQILELRKEYEKNIEDTDAPVEVVEVDEMHTFVGQKKVTAGFGLR